MPASGTWLTSCASTAWPMRSSGHWSTRSSCPTSRATAAGSVPTRCPAGWPSHPPKLKTTEPRLHADRTNRLRERPSTIEDAALWRSWQRQDPLLLHCPQRVAALGGRREPLDPGSPHPVCDHRELG